MKRIVLAIVLGTLLASLGGCAKLMGNLRKDLDDTEYRDNSPVIGGKWTERGFLDESMPEYGTGAGTYGAVGHSDRSLASSVPEANTSGNSWVSPDQADQARRDAFRESINQANPLNTSQAPVVEPPVKRVYKNGTRATRSDFVDESQNEGSLWASNGQTNYFFTKNKVRGVGDIINVTMEAELVRDMSLEVRRTLSPRETSIEIGKAQDRIRAKLLGLPDPDKVPDGKDAVTTTQASTRATPKTEAEKEKEKDREAELMATMPPAQFSDIDVSRALEVKAGENMMGEIIERYPNGNYKIRATRKIMYRNGASRLMTLIGIARSQDITEDDVVPSGKLYEYRLQAVN